MLREAPIAGDAYVFDKAVFHLASVRARGLDDDQASVHMGLFFGWAVERGLTAGWLEDRAPEAFAAFRRRETTGPALIRVWDAALLDDMFNDEGLAFAASYLHPREGGYFADYQAFAADLPSEFAVPDSWASYDALLPVLDARYREWRAAWDPAAGRPDLRGPQDGAAVEAPEAAVVPVMGIVEDVALPGSPIGLYAGRQETVEALRAAHAGDGWVAVFPADRRPHEVADLEPRGVLARLEQLDADGEGVRAILQVVHRVTRGQPAGDWRAFVTRVADPALRPEDRGSLDALREAAAEILRGRRARGEPLGRLAMAPSLAPVALVDVLARELRLTREERRLVLDVDDLGDRMAILQVARGR